MLVYQRATMFPVKGKSEVRIQRIPEDTDLPPLPSCDDSNKMPPTLEQLYENQCIYLY